MGEHLDLIRELQKMRNLKVTIIPIIIGTIGTIPKDSRKFVWTGNQMENQMAAEINAMRTITESKIDNMPNYNNCWLQNIKD